MASAPVTFPPVPAELLADTPPVEEPTEVVETTPDDPESPQEEPTPTEPPAPVANPLQTMSGPPLPPLETGVATGWQQEEFPNMPRDGMVSRVPGPVFVKGTQSIPGMVLLTENVYLARYIPNTKAPVYTLKYVRSATVPLAHVVLVQ